MNETVKSYFKKIFSKKQLITKGIILAAAALIVIVPAVCFYATWSGLTNPPDPIYSGAFIRVKISWNPGIATSALAGNFGAIYAIQSIVFIILLAVFVFLTQDKVSCSFVALAIFGGLFNLIQRICAPAAHANCVFDYFNFVPWLQWMSLGNTVFNWPDMGVVIGVIGFVISYIVHIILQIVKDNKKDKEAAAKAKAYEESKTSQVSRK